MAHTWFVMIVKDPDKVSRFYTEVAGLRREPCEEPNGCTSYTLKDADGNDILGIVDETNFPDWVPGWLPYLEIENFEERVARVQTEGGTILKQMTWSYKFPGQLFCLVKDPSGAPVMLCEAAPK